MILKNNKHVAEPRREVVQGNLSLSLTLLLEGTREAHWTFEEAHFYAFYKFFESQYDQMDKIVDNV